MELTRETMKQIVRLSRRGSGLPVRAPNTPSAHQGWLIQRYIIDSRLCHKLSRLIRVRSRVLERLRD
jgi:hypothetical protein